MRPQGDLAGAAAELQIQEVIVNQILYGVAYYDEYMPYDRLHKDIEMMK